MDFAWPAGLAEMWCMEFLHGLRHSYIASNIGKVVNPCKALRLLGFLVFLFGSCDATNRIIGFGWIFLLFQYTDWQHIP